MFHGLWLLGCRQNVPWCCMPSLSSGWRSLTAAAELQSTQFCHHSPQSILKISRFQNTSFFFFFFVQCINAKHPPSQLHPHPPPNSYQLSFLIERKILCMRCSRWAELRKMNRIFLAKSTVMVKFFVCLFCFVDLWLYQLTFLSSTTGSERNVFSISESWAIAIHARSFFYLKRGLSLATHCSCQMFDWMSEAAELIYNQLFIELLDLQTPPDFTLIVLEHLNCNDNNSG